MRAAAVRKTPYTELGIKRVGCIRCGKKASAQWNICADGGNFRPICSSCDIQLNRLVLHWARIPNASEKMAKYAYDRLNPADHGE